MDTTYVFLHDAYADWEIGYVLPEIQDAGRDVVTFGLTGDRVRSLGGLRVTPDAGLDAVRLERAGLVVLPGGTFWKDFAGPALDRLVLDARSRRVPVAAICGATGYVARLGLLDGVDHTSNSLAFLKERAPAYRGESRYRDALAVSDGGVVTASGLGAVDFTYEILDLVGVAGAGVWYRAMKHGEEPDAPPGRFVVLLSKVAGRDASEATILRHVEYLRALDRDGRLVGGGPFVDHPSGMLVLRAADRDEAVRTASADPFVVEGARTFEVRTWMPAHRQNGYLRPG